MQTQFYSPNEVLLREILEGKTIESEDEKLLRRLTESFDDLLPKTIFRLKEKLFSVKNSLESYLPVELENWELLADNPQEFEISNAKFLKVNSSYLHVKPMARLVYDVGDYFVACQSEVLSLHAVLKISKRYTNFLQNRIEELEARVKEFESETEQNEPSVPVLPLKEENKKRIPKPKKPFSENEEEPIEPLDDDSDDFEDDNEEEPEIVGI